MSDKWDESLVKPLAEMSVEEVEEFLTSVEFYSPSWYSQWSEKTYPESWSEPGDWHAIEDAAGQDGGIDLPIGNVRLVDSFGGEGQGDDYYMILSIQQGDVIRTFKMNGYHVSHDGSYYDGPFVEVKPRLKTITVWE